MQRSYASGVPCVPTCDKPCFKASSSFGEHQRLQPPTALLGDPAPRAGGHLGLSPGKETLASWPSLGTGTCLTVDQDKRE